MNNFLNPDEVIISDLGYRGLYKKNDPPEHDRRKVLDGMRRLWIRVVKYLRTSPDELQEWETWMNNRIEDAGGSEKISLTDESYLNILDPMVATAPWWGRGTLAFHENLGMETYEPEVLLTPDKTVGQTPEEVASDLAEILIEPLNDPF